MKILVGYTGSKAGKAALDLAVVHAKAFGAQVNVVFSLNKKAEKNSKKIHEAEQVLEYADRFYGKASIPCKTALLIRGLSHGEDLIQYANEHHIDEIIIGASRSSLVGKLVFGNTAQYVILNADCPVVLTKSRLHKNMAFSRYLATEKVD